MTVVVLTMTQIDALRQLAAFGCFDESNNCFALGDRQIAKSTASSLVGRGFAQFITSPKLPDVLTVRQIRLSPKGEQLLRPFGQQQTNRMQTEDAA